MCRTEKFRGDSAPVRIIELTHSEVTGISGIAEKMTTEDLLATCWTTAGDATPGSDDERSPLSLRERAEAAGAAGFTGGT